MKAVTILAGELAVQDHEDPCPVGEEVLVRVRAAGINNADLLQKAGKYPAPPGSPKDIPGLEFAGEVFALGPAASRFAIGDRVMGIAGGGGQAELACAHERLLMPVPDALTWAQAGGFAEAFVTAHDALFSQAKLRPGERVLIHGAAGGVGMAGVQIAAAAGAEVVASVRSKQNWDVVRKIGASTTIDPADVEHNGPYDVILELVGAVNFAVNLRSLNIGGRIIVIGTSEGSETQLDLRLLSRKRGAIMASTLRARPLEEKAIAMRAVEHELLPLVSRGVLTVMVAASFPLHDAAVAYQSFTTRGKAGKVVLSSM